MNAWKTTHAIHSLTAPTPKAPTLVNVKMVTRETDRSALRVRFNEHHFTLLLQRVRKQTRCWSKSFFRERRAFSSLAPIFARLECRKSSSFAEQTDKLNASWLERINTQPWKPWACWLLANRVLILLFLPFQSVLSLLILSSLWHCPKLKMSNKNNEGNDYSKTGFEVDANPRLA